MNIDLSWGLWTSSAPERVALIGFAAKARDAAKGGALRKKRNAARGANEGNPPGSGHSRTLPRCGPSQGLHPCFLATPCSARE
ncbi:hypothetical protein [Niveibacterium sp.]|uniref:hypothetical protein n=1 Tax=Niveibacterium sp. TaxID=2017444 RepID=UPI0035B3DDC2